MVVSTKRIWGDEDMSVNVVNLDALIPREDLAIHDLSTPSGTVDKITIPHLNSFVFAPDLRKPHFQRETNQWTPKKIVDLLTAFVDRDLIPAVILWRAGRYIFVVDGAHRLSALLAWIHNDYGDGKRSSEFFGGNIPDDQRKIAEKTRKAVDKAIGSYTDYIQVQQGVPPKNQSILQRVAKFADCHVIAQWVPTADAKSAEDSFFKINQAATPIDPTERRLLKARDSASAIAARAITNAGSGHRYWSNFPKTTQAEIEEISKKIYEELYLPPIRSFPINTLDVPVAGRGYNALPFVFDLVNYINGVSVKDTSNKNVSDNLPADVNGDTTLNYLKNVRAKISLITTDESRSLGLHPVIYFYTRSGSFKPESFHAIVNFLDYLVDNKKLSVFHKIRAYMEDYVIDHKEASALIVHKYGTGDRSIPWLITYYKKLFEWLSSGYDAAKIDGEISRDQNFAFLSLPAPPRSITTGQGKAFSSATKTASYFASALQGSVRCAICNARVHQNSMHIDHKTEKRNGGDSGVSNAQVTHPYCDSSKP